MLNMQKSIFCIYMHCTPNFHNKERRKGSIYLAANGAAEYRSHQDHCIVRCRDLEA